MLITHGLEDFGAVRPSCPTCSRGATKLLCADQGFDRRLMRGNGCTCADAARHHHASDPEKAGVSDADGQPRGQSH